MAYLDLSATLLALQLATTFAQENKCAQSAVAVFTDLDHLQPLRALEAVLENLNGGGPVEYWMVNFQADIQRIVLSNGTGKGVIFNRRSERDQCEIVQYLEDLGYGYNPNDRNDAPERFLASTRLQSIVNMATRTCNNLIDGSPPTVFGDNGIGETSLNEYHETDIVPFCSGQPRVGPSPKQFCYSSTVGGVKSHRDAAAECTRLGGRLPLFGGQGDKQEKSYFINAAQRAITGLRREKVGASVWLRGEQLGNCHSMNPRGETQFGTCEENLHQLCQFTEGCAVPNVDNADTNYVRNVPFGGSVTYTCHAGYILEGLRTLRCTCNELVGHPPVCQRGTTPPPTTTTTAGTTTAWTTPTGQTTVTPATATTAASTTTPSKSTKSTTTSALVMPICPDPAEFKNTSWNTIILTVSSKNPNNQYESAPLWFVILISIVVPAAAVTFTFLTYKSCPKHGPKAEILSTSSLPTSSQLQRIWQEELADREKTAKALRKEVALRNKVLWCLTCGCYVPPPVTLEPTQLCSRFAFDSSHVSRANISKIGHGLDSGIGIHFDKSARAPAEKENPKSPKKYASANFRERLSLRRKKKSSKTKPAELSKIPKIPTLDQNKPKAAVPREPDKYDRRPTMELGNVQKQEKPTSPGYQEKSRKREFTSPKAPTLLNVEQSVWYPESSRPRGEKKRASKVDKKGRGVEDEKNQTGKARTLGTEGRGETIETETKGKANAGVGRVVGSSKKPERDNRTTAIENTQNNENDRRQKTTEVDRKEKGDRYRKFKDKKSLTKDRAPSTTLKSPVLKAPSVRLEEDRTNATFVETMQRIASPTIVPKAPPLNPRDTRIGASDVKR